jgi:hypothetical protein
MSLSPEVQQVLYQAFRGQSSTTMAACRTEAVRDGGRMRNLRGQVLTALKFVAFDSHQSFSSRSLPVRGQVEHLIQVPVSGLS